MMKMLDEFCKVETAHCDGLSARAHHELFSALARSAYNPLSHEVQKLVRSVEKLGTKAAATKLNIDDYHDTHKNDSKKHEVDHPTI